MNRRVILLLILVALLAPSIAVLVAETRVGRAVERRVYDGWFTIRGSLPRPAEVVIVAIDIDSEASLGRYPWSRDWHTHLIRNLHRAGASVIAFDATFADAFPEEDMRLRQVIDSTGIVILGAKTNVTFQRYATGFELEEPAGVLRGAPIGIVDLQASPTDGVVREYPVVHRYPQGTVPQLGIRAVLDYLGLPPDAIETTRDGWWIEDRFIPRGPTGGMLINFLGTPGSVSTYSYSSVVDDAETDIGEWTMDEFETLLEEGRFEGRIVLVGTTVPEHQDLHATPFRDPGRAGGAIHTPGVEIHAHAIATVLAGNHLREVSRPVQYAWTLLLGLLLIAVAARMRLGLSTAIGVVLVATAMGASWYLFSSHGLWLWAIAPALSVGLAYSGSAVVLFLAEEKEKARIRGMFQQYVAESVVDQLIERPELLALGGEERVLTVLFTDVVGFATISESLTPTELVELLNEYLTAMSDVVLEHGGIIDKYQGDALMAEFGAPVPVPDHALRACLAALGMNRELARLRQLWAEQGRPRLRARIGINTGPMLVGNLGSLRIMDYTVMGDHVNLASRLEGTGKVYGTDIIVSEFTWNEVQDRLIGRELDRIRVKGKAEAVGIYELLATREEGVSAETEALIRDFAAALALYRDGRFGDALAAFEALVARYPDDGPSHLYLERAAAYLVNPPPESWDGVFAMTTK